MEDWYKITVADFEAHRGAGVLRSHYKDSPSLMVTSVFNTHEWQMWKFTEVRGIWASRQTQEKFMVYHFGCACVELLIF